MTLANLFENTNLILCRKVNMYEVEISDPLSAKDKLRDFKFSLEMWGIKEGIGKALYYNPKNVDSILKVSYVELYDMDGTKYYLFKSLTDLEYLLGLCKNSNSDELSKLSIYQTWKKLNSQQEKDKYFKIHSGIAFEYINKILVRLSDLDVVAWDHFKTGHYRFSTDCTYNKKNQLTDSYNYSEQCVLSYDLRNGKSLMEPDRDTEKLKEQFSVWKRIKDHWSYYLGIRELLTTEEYEELKAIYDSLYMKASALLDQDRTINTEEQMKQAGKKGEYDVEYELKWLPEDFVVIDKRDGIILRCNQMLGEKQEFDHIVVSSQGIFSIETKNYAGKIVIDHQGNWVRHKLDGSIVGEENPTAQLMRHHRVLEEIVGKVEIHDLLCIANSKTIIEGAENSPIPVVKHDMLSYYLWNYRNENNKTYSKEEIRMFVERIESHRINR